MNIHMLGDTKLFTTLVRFQQLHASVLKEF
jgi:hypothetical protein